jgi:hypothetical protein
MSDCGCRIADVGCRIADCGLRIAMWDDFLVFDIPWASPTVIEISPFQGWVFCGSDFLASLFFFRNH